MAAGSARSASAARAQTARLLLWFAGWLIDCGSSSVEPSPLWGDAAGDAAGKAAGEAAGEAIACTGARDTVGGGCAALQSAQVHCCVVVAEALVHRHPRCPRRSHMLRSALSAAMPSSMIRRPCACSMLPRHAMRARCTGRGIAAPASMCSTPENASENGLCRASHSTRLARLVSSVASSAPSLSLLSRRSSATSWWQTSDRVLSMGDGKVWRHAGARLSNLRTC